MIGEGIKEIPFALKEAVQIRIISAPLFVPCETVRSTSGAVCP